MAKLIGAKPQELLGPKAPTVLSVFRGVRHAFGVAQNSLSRGFYRRFWSMFPLARASHFGTGFWSHSQLAVASLLPQRNLPPGFAVDHINMPCRIFDLEETACPVSWQVVLATPPKPQGLDHFGPFLVFSRTSVGVKDGGFPYVP